MRGWLQRALLWVGLLGGLVACRENDRYLDLGRGAMPVNAVELQSAVAGGVFTGTVNGVPFRICLAADGSARGTAGTIADEGFWRAGQGGQLCLRWKHVAHGFESCGQYYRLESTFLAYDTTTGARLVSGHAASGTCVSR
jgi:hypothetical protein